MGNDGLAGADQRAAALDAWVRRVLADSSATMVPASADASFRCYFRVHHRGGSLIAMDAPPDREDSRLFLATAGYFRSLGLNVPVVLEADLESGFLLLTDLGERHYLQALENGDDPDRLYGDALEALLPLATTRAPVGLLPPYDRTRLRAEMALFEEWFLPANGGHCLGPGDRAVIEAAYDALIELAQEQPTAIVHRDYHSRNLLVTPTKNPGIIDFQDAVIGPVTYDPVSLLKDCYIRWPDSRVEGWLDTYRQRLAEVAPEAFGLIAPEQFRLWFDAMGLQRHLKVLGIFTRLHQRDGKAGYLADIPRVLDYVRVTAARLPACHGLLEVIERALSAADRPPGAAP